MNTKAILFSSAVLLGIAGILLLFAPAEILAACGFVPDNIPQVYLQITGSLYFAFAMLNWMMKGSVVGGIYNKPLTVANFAHFSIGALAMVKMLYRHPGLPFLFWAAALGYVFYAVAFGLLFNRHPENKKPN